jgi:hypothetical protein
MKNMTLEIMIKDLLYIYYSGDLFYNAVSISESIALEGRMFGE